LVSFPQRLGVSLARDPDDEPEAAAAARLDPGDRVLDDHAAARLGSQRARPLEEGVGCGLSGELLASGEVCVDLHLEEVLDPSRHEHGLAVATRRHDAGPQPRRA